MRSSIHDPKCFFGADILRGVAILSVVLYHTFGRLYGFCLPWNGNWQDFHAPPSEHFLVFYPASFGWAGVALFFVLSGFCIHTSCLRSPRFTNAQFFWHRFWRIYPAYLVALVAFCCLERLDLTTSGGVKQLLAHVLLVHNFHHASFFGINPAFWSIAAEVQLYLLFPVVLLLRRRWGMGGCLAITFVASMLWRLMAVALCGLQERVGAPAFNSPIMTWFDWTLGAYIAERTAQQRRAFTKHAVWLAVLAPAFVFSTVFKPLTVFSFSLAAAVSAVVLDLMVSMRSSRNLGLSFLAFTGLISYSVYLWHQPLLSMLSGWFGRFAPSLIAGVATAGAIAGLSWLSYRLIEREGSRLGKRLWERRAAPARASLPEGTLAPSRRAAQTSPAPVSPVPCSDSLPK